MRELDRKKLELQKIKASAAIAELEYKIAEREEDIQRILDHIEKQKEIIQKTQKQLEDN